MIFFVYKWFPLVTQADEVIATIKSSRVWTRLKKLNLKTNMRVEYSYALLYRLQKQLNQFCEHFKLFLEISRKFED